MALAERTLKFTFSGAQSGSFSAEGLRAAVQVQAYQGRLGAMAQVKVWGLSLAQMNNYSAQIPTALGINKFGLVVEAGNIGGQLAQVINGVIWESYVDLTDAPDAAFQVSVAGVYTAAIPAASQSQAPKQPGTPSVQNAEDLIQSLCALGGFTFSNSAGAHAVLRNQATYGSPLDQIDTVARAAGFSWSLNGNVIAIWPADGAIDNTVVQVGPGTDPQMVGYPQYWEQGIIVTSLFNQQVQVGRKMQVVGSSIPKANGTWSIVNVRHDLTTMLPKGPWFTTAVLGAPA